MNCGTLVPTSEYMIFVNECIVNLPLNLDGNANIISLHCSIQSKSVSVCIISDQ